VHIDDLYDSIKAIKKVHLSLSKADFMAYRKNRIGDSPLEVIERRPIGNGCFS